MGKFLVSLSRGPSVAWSDKESNYLSGKFLFLLDRASGIRLMVKISSLFLGCFLVEKDFDASSKFSSFFFISSHYKYFLRLSLCIIYNIIILNTSLPNPKRQFEQLLSNSYL